MTTKNKSERSGVCWSSFFTGMLIMAVLSIFALPFANPHNSRPEKSVVQPISIDYKRIEVAADIISESAKSIRDTERAWEIIAAKMILDHESQVAEKKKKSTETKNEPWKQFAEAQSQTNSLTQKQIRFDLLYGTSQAGIDESRLDNWTPPPPRSLTAENGSWRGQPNANGVAKTVHVKGYYRKDGTYVRGHYRSAPR